jgi:hypothetical protein
MEARQFKKKMTQVERMEIPSLGREWPGVSVHRPVQWLICDDSLLSFWERLFCDAGNGF